MTIPNGLDRDNYKNPAPEAIDIIDKRTWKHELALCDERLEGEFKQYTQEDLRELLK